MSSRSEHFSRGTSDGAPEGAMENRPDATIFDMDGTLADVSAIRHLVKGPRRDFHAFHTQSVDSPPNPDVVNMAHAAKEKGHAVVVVTARSEQYRPHTSMWLAMHGVPSDALYMRDSGDTRPDYEAKADILQDVRRRFNPVHAVDDNPNVIRLWKENNIGTTVVPGWED